MKKLLLSLGFVAATLAASAQTLPYEPTAALTIYKGGNAPQFWNGAGYAYGDGDFPEELTFVDKDSVKSEGDTALFISGNTHKPAGYYIGGYNGQCYNEVQLSLSDYYIGSYATTKVKIDVEIAAPSELHLVFVSGGTEYGYVLKNGSNELDILDFKVNANGVGNDWGYSLASMTESEFLAVQDIKIKLQNSTGVGAGKAFIDNFVITDGTTGIVEDFVASNSNAEVSAYDMMGKFVAAGKYNELVSGLESGKVYVLRSANNAIKIVK